MLCNWLLVMLGGALGASCRWGLGAILLPHLYPIPLGTLSVNWIGSFLIGLTLPIATHVSPLPDSLRMLFVTGFLGSFTTYSTFSGEVVTMMMQGEYFWMSATLLANLVGSLLLTFLGTMTIRSLLS